MIPDQYPHPIVTAFHGLAEIAALALFVSMAVVWSALACGA